MSAAGVGVRFRTAQWAPGYPMVDKVVESTVTRYTTQLACILGMYIVCAECGLPHTCCSTNI